MVTDQTTLIVALAGLAALALLTLAASRAFAAWLELKRAELAQSPACGLPATSARIEVADLKERVRKLEAIAAGVDL